MEAHDAKALYDDDYASKYNDLWEDNPAWAPEARQHVDALTRLLGPGARWLDVGCGTGWILSQFPEVPRAGIDLSPSMLSQARAANPDAISFREGDIRVDVPEWFGGWDLVSTTGQPWSYVESMAEVARIAENMARWTSPTGSLFIQPPDIFDLSGLEIDYDFVGAPRTELGMSITAAIWTFHDDGGDHVDMVFPSVDVWVKWLCQWFGRVEVQQWHHAVEFLPGGRRALVAQDKRGPGDLAPAEVTIVNVDEHGARTEIDRITSAVPPRPLEPPAPIRLADRPLSYVLKRVAPWRPEMRRALAGRWRRLTSSKAPDDA